MFRRQCTRSRLRRLAAGCPSSPFGRVGWSRVEMFHPGFSLDSYLMVVFLVFLVSGPVRGRLNADVLQTNTVLRAAGFTV